LLFSLGKGALEHAEDLFHGVDVGEDACDQVKGVLVCEIFILGHAQRQEISSIEKSHHSLGDLLAHSDLDVRSGEGRTAWVHDEYPYEAKKEVKETKEEKDRDDEGASDEAKDANE
jgi:hypothetical protein